MVRAMPEGYAPNVVKRNAAPLIAVLVAAALVGLLVYGVAQRADNRTLDEAVAKGQRPVAPSRALPVLGAAASARWPASAASW